MKKVNLASQIIATISFVGCKSEVSKKSLYIKFLDYLYTPTVSISIDTIIPEE